LNSHISEILDFGDFGDELWPELGLVDD
jgi:hypothetical protein